MSNKIIPNKLETLTYFILDNYNTRLKCEGCRKTWTPDGSAFMRDQGGSKGGMYYRQFRCKGKGKGQCTTAYGHEDFLDLATRQLGQNAMDEIKRLCGMDFSEEGQVKRAHEPVSTGFTPPRKRISARQTPLPLRLSTESERSPPQLPKPFPFPDRREFLNKRRHSGYESIDESVDDQSARLQIRLERAEMTIEMLREKLDHKDEYIGMLKEEIQRLSRSAPPTVVNSPTVGPMAESSGSQSYVRVTQTPVSPTVCRVGSPGSQSYVQVAQTPPESRPVQILRRTPSVKSPDHRAKLGRKHGLAIVYLTGLQQRRVGQFKKEAREKGLSLKSVQNISFIGNSIAEILVESSEYGAFVDRAKSVGFDVCLDLDVAGKSKQNPVWLHYGGEGFSLSDVVKSNFVRRVSHEIKSATEERVRRFYLEWAESLGWKDSLAVLSTDSPSL